MAGLTNMKVEFHPMQRIFFHLISAVLIALPLIPAHAAEPATREPYGIGLEGFAYPYPVSMLPLVNDGEQVRMAYMDVAPRSRTAARRCCCMAVIFRRAIGRR